MKVTHHTDLMPVFVSHLPNSCHLRWMTNPLLIVLLTLDLSWTYWWINDGCFTVSHCTFTMWESQLLWFLSTVPYRLRWLPCSSLHAVQTAGRHPGSWSDPCHYLMTQVSGYETAPCGCGKIRTCDTNLHELLFASLRDVICGEMEQHYIFFFYKSNWANVHLKLHLCI